MPNLRMAAKHYCQPEEIFLIIDGDDMLLGRQVLKLFNAAFQKYDAWFVYSNFLTITKKLSGTKRRDKKTLEALKKEIKEKKKYNYSSEFSLLFDDKVVFSNNSKKQTTNNKLIILNNK